MKIVIISQYFLPEMGAPQNRLFELAQGLKRKGWEVNVITAMPNYPTGKIFPGYRGKFSMNEMIADLAVRRYWLIASNAPRALPRILSMVSFSASVLFSVFLLRRNRPTFILVESPPLTLAFSAWMLSKLSGAKMIMNVSDLWPLSAKELGAIKEGLLYRWIEKLEYFLYRKSDICLGQSQEIIDYISKRTMSQVFLFRNGVDTSRFEIQSRQSSHQQKPRLVYAGLLGVAQGILSICENIDFSKTGFEFHIYGSGTEATAIENFLAHNKESGIFYHGVVSRSSMPEILKQYDATLIALVRNIYGAVPSKIYESMASGMPIFFSGSGEGAIIVEENKLGWVNQPFDWSKLISNLTSYLRLTHEDKITLRARCRRIAEEKFDRKKQIDNLDLFLKNR